MNTTKLTIYLTPELAASVEKHAANAGKKKAPFVSQILAESLQLKQDTSTEKTFEKIVQVQLEQSFMWKRLYQALLSTRVPAQTAMAMLSDAEREAKADVRAALGGQV